MNAHVWMCCLCECAHVAVFGWMCSFDGVRFDALTGMCSCGLFV